MNIKSKYLGPLLIIGSHFTFATSHSLVKFISTTMPVNQIMFMRFLIPTLTLLPLFIFKVIKLDFKNPFLLLTRAVIGIIAMYMFYISIQMAGLGKMNLLFQLSIIWATIMAIILFKERPSIWTLLAIPVSFIGLALILKPTNITNIRLPEIIAFSASILLGGVNITIKALRKDHSAMSIIIIFFVFSTRVLAPTYKNFVPINSSTSICILISIGFLSLLAQILMTSGYKYTTASIGSAVGLISIPLMYVLGIFLFAEKIDILSIIGVLIVTTSLYTIVKKQ
jgi:drug/metabolite transporter (DMT)-like permease